MAFNSLTATLSIATPAQVATGAVCVNRTAETRFYQHRQTSRVVDVSVAQNHCVNVFQLKRKCFLVAFFVLAPSLDQAAVEQQAFVSHGNQVTGSGHFFRSAQDLHSD